MTIRIASARDGYDWVDDAAFVDSDGACCRCGARVVAWTEAVPCCGYPFECTDTLYCFACDRCELIGDHF